MRLATGRTALFLVFFFLFLLSFASAPLRAQGAGLRVVAGDLPADAHVFTRFSFGGATYVAHSPDHDPRTIALSRVEPFGLVRVQDIRVPLTPSVAAAISHAGAVDSPIHRNPKIGLPFFARTAGWIYFLDSGGGAVAQLRRTDGAITQTLTHFDGTGSGNNRSFFDAVHVRHLSDTPGPKVREGGPFLIYEVLDTEPDRLYYLAVEHHLRITSQQTYKLELYSIGDSEFTPQRLVSNVRGLDRGLDNVLTAAFSLLQNLGGQRILVDNHETGYTQFPYLVAHARKKSVTLSRSALWILRQAGPPGAPRAGQSKVIYGRSPNDTPVSSVPLNYPRLHLAQGGHGGRGHRKCCFYADKREKAQRD